MDLCHHLASSLSCPPGSVHQDHLYGTQKLELNSDPISRIVFSQMNSWGFHFVLISVGCLLKAGPGKFLPVAQSLLLNSPKKAITAPMADAG